MAVKLGKVGKKRTRSAAKKRIKKTGSGKYAIEKCAHNHLLLQKSKRQKAKASKPIVLAKGDADRVAQMF
jgi:large subunit ribosomal protein L35